jgi:glutamate formiminotransferase
MAIILQFMALIECVPNVSEGRRPEVVEALAEAVRNTSGVRLLDYSADWSHNRSVFTLVGSADAIEQGVVALFARAIADIDLRTHRGEHPRLGAVDVVPLVPLDGSTMADCVTLAKKIGLAVADRFGVPVYLYEEASTNPARKHLEDIRRGGFEGLGAKMQREGWAPDFGPSIPHPSAGASIIGARPPLIAYNVNLASDRLEVAKAVAARVRARAGGLRAVKAIGVALADRGLVQVSMNLTNYRETSIRDAFEAVKREAAAYGVEVSDSELIGLAPAAALDRETAVQVKLRHFGDACILERALLTSSSPIPNS